MTRTAAELFLTPASVVVYGASSDPAKLSGRPLDYLRRLGYEGNLYAVNPRRDVVQGVPAYASIADVPGPVDLAVVVVPADKVPDAIEQCAAAGVRAATIFASGFAEAAGDAGTAAQDRISRAAARSGMRVLGPNCLGSFALPTNAFATFSTAFDATTDPLDAPIALVSQSGAVGTFTYSAMTSVGLGVRYFANPGNQVDVTVVELLHELVLRDDVKVLIGHMEALGDLEAFDRLAADAASAGKPLILLKSGRTRVGKRAIAAHTGSVAGDHQEFVGICDRHGVIRARSMEEVVDLSLALASGRRPAGANLTLITQSGGAGALASDVALDEGLAVEPWDEKDRAVVDALLPHFASTANPLDLTGAMINDVSILDRTLAIATSNPRTDSILVVLGNSDKAADELVAICAKHHAATDKPFLVSWTGGTGQARLDLLAAGVPTYTEPARAVRVVGHLTRANAVVPAASANC